MRPRRRAIIGLTVLGLLGPEFGTPPVVAQTVPAMILTANQFVAPLTESEQGLAMPTYMAWSQNTRFGGTEAGVAPRDMVSNTVAIPRSQWGAPGTDEWEPVLGVLAGSMDPFPMDDYAHDYYLATGISEGRPIEGGDDIGFLSMWFSPLNILEGDPQPSANAGSFQWTSLPEWTNVLTSTTTDYVRAETQDGTAIRGPAERFRRSMYLTHSQLSATGGDVAAGATDLLAPAHELSVPTPPGTVMSLQLAGYSRDGPWADAEIGFDWQAGTTSAPKGEWRVPVNITLPRGKRIPERADVPGSASPQSTLGITGLGIPLLPDEAGPAANEVHLMASVQPGQDMTYEMALRQPDGSTRVQKLRLNEPGTYRWRVENGRLVEETPPMGVPGVEVASGTLADDGPADAEEVGAAQAAQPNSGSLVINQAGRPVMTDVVRDGTRLVDSLDVASVVVGGRTLELGAWNRDGPVSLWANSRGTQTTASAAYRIEGILIVVRLRIYGAGFVAYVTSHSADGKSHPHSLEATTDLADGVRIVDRLTGEVKHSMRVLEAAIWPRLLLETPKKAYVLGPPDGYGARVAVTNGGAEPTGEPLTDPVLVMSAPRPGVWSMVGVHFQAAGYAARTLEPPVGGGFTAVTVYRAAPLLLDRPVELGGGPLEPTRDLDGTETFAVAFAAERADGSPILRSEITGLDLSLRTGEGDQLFSGSFSGAPWTPDDGDTWGVLLRPVGELSSMDVHVYARATYQGGTVAAEHSPDVPLDDWWFTIDRVPVQAAGGPGGTVTGTTDPGAAVQGSIPELGLSAQTQADASGAFTLSFPMEQVPGGDYEVAIRAQSAVPDLPTAEPSTTNTIPDDETGWTTARLRHVPAGESPAAHRTAPPIDTDAAVSFLSSRLQDGAFDSSLRATTWAVAGLDAAGAPRPVGTASYLSSLATAGGYAWRPGEALSSTATGLATSALDTMGVTAALDPSSLIRWDGGGVLGDADVSSIEGAALTVVALDATGSLQGLDPFWLDRVGDYLDAAEPRSSSEAYARLVGLLALGRATSGTITGADLDATAYRVLTGTAAPDDLATYQLSNSGVAMTRTGSAAEAFPTALALAALR